ncbi:hypothetical protein [Sandaracinus amylolyticus]|uniref:hypothetical protein n=1 Tax=Sandaracinus amylolyticus TaxID=927083 RepID=UPI001F3754C9|nr:hypothetical protein [Sandaracinus amylolyticus]UJR81524.1 Hypothetical protein I5071_35840 [Sandaracinus amylolyticus]
MVRSSFAAATLVVLVGCATPAGPRSHDASTRPVDAADAAMPERRCVAPAGVSGSPRTIADVVALIDALPPPVTIPCVLESLDRPLYVEATSSRLSAQPAVGERSPRIFLFFGDLVISVVPEGLGAPLLEMSEFVDTTRSRKAELAFPVSLPLSEAAPYERLGSTGTLCGGCHGREVRDEIIAGAFVSLALRPHDEHLVAIDRVRSEWLACRAEDERCAMLDALFGRGAVVHQGFPPELPTH